MIIQNCLVKLVAVFEQSFGYITYVFKYLLPEDVKRYKDEIVICTRYPNWQCKNILEGEVGFVEIEVVRAGIDEYFDGEKMVKFRNNAKRFIKFVPKTHEENEEDFTL